MSMRYEARDKLTAQTIPTAAPLTVFFKNVRGARACVVKVYGGNLAHAVTISGGLSSDGATKAVSGQAASAAGTPLTANGTEATAGIATIAPSTSIGTALVGFSAPHVWMDLQAATADVTGCTIETGAIFDS
jgi:hypothetical protein